MFFFDSQITGLIQNEQNILQYLSISQNPRSICTTSGTIFSADVLIGGGQVIFQYKTWCIPLEAFASN